MAEEYKKQLATGMAQDNAKSYGINPNRGSMPSWSSQPGYRAEGLNNGPQPQAGPGTATGSMPSMSAPQLVGNMYGLQGGSRGGNNIGLNTSSFMDSTKRYYQQGEDVYAVDAGVDTLPKGSNWLTYNSTGGFYGNGAWENLREGQAGYTKPETIEEKKTRLLKESNQKYAKEFREQLPETEQKLIGQLGQETSRGLNKNIQGIREGASSRGLLYSGMRQGAEAGARNQAGGLLARGQQGIKESLRKQAESLDNQAIQSGIDIQQSQQRIADMAYQQALAEMQSENSMFGSIMGAVGTAVGMAYGGPAGAAAGGAAGRAIA